MTGRWGASEEGFHEALGKSQRPGDFWWSKALRHAKRLAPAGAPVAVIFLALLVGNWG